MLYYSAVFISTVFSIALFYLPLHNLWFYYLSYIPSSYFSLCSYHYSGRLLGFVIVWFVFFSINALSLFIFPSVFLSLLFLLCHLYFVLRLLVLFSLLIFTLLYRSQPLSTRIVSPFVVFVPAGDLQQTTGHAEMGVGKNIVVIYLTF